MSTEVIQKYKDINPINDEKTTHTLMQMLVDTPRDRLAAFYAGSAAAGRFYLFKNDQFPDKLIEYVPGLPGDDSVTTLFSGHRIFETRATLLAARTELIEAIERLLMAVPGTAVVRDEGREREVHLHELGVAQLLDTLIHFSQKSPLILTA